MWFAGRNLLSCQRSVFFAKCCHPPPNHHQPTPPPDLSGPHTGRWPMAHQRRPRTGGPGCPAGRPRSVLPCGVDLLHVAATFDRCAALALGRVHVWAVRPAGEVWPLGRASCPYPRGWRRRRGPLGDTPTSVLWSHLARGCIGRAMPPHCCSTGFLYHRTQASVALSPLLSLDVGSADVPRVPPVVGGGPVCLLLTPAFLCLVCHLYVRACVDVPVCF